MGMEFLKKTEESEALSRRNKLQMLLALRFYHEAHPYEDVKINDPRANSREVQKNALMEWERNSEQFNALFEKIPENADISDPVVVDSIFMLLHKPKNGSGNETLTPPDLI